jgi:hypothetical protein
MLANAGGDIATAREKWSEAVKAAPGTPPALQAQQLLDQTAGSLDQ